MNRGRVTGLVAGALGVGALALGWMFFAPTQAGGGTSYAIIVGTSMEPKLHRGDLAVVRERAAYRAGDVVLYDSKDLGTKVLHRIVRVEGDRFVLKGDNNDFIDPERPTEAQIVGTLWVTAPGVGRVTEWLREPLHGALLVGLVTLIALGGGLGAGSAVRRGTASATRSRPAASRLPSPVVADEHKPMLLWLAGAGAACLILGIVSFGRPLTGTESVEAAYAHQGRFAYEARVPRNAAYPDGHVTTGEPVFLRLVSRVRVSFDYDLESELPVRTRGRIGLSARISDGRGWERTLPLAPDRRFAARDATVSGVLDVRRIERIVDEVRTLTGSGQTAFTVAVLPRVEVAGRVGAEPVDTTFAPALTFDLGDLRLQPSLDAGEGVGPFAPREPGSGTRPAPAKLSLGALSLSVATARRVSLIGIAALLLLGGLALISRRRRGDADETERIDARYGHLIVPVASRSVGLEQVTELADMDALVRLALHHGRLILHVVEGRDHCYVVEEGGAAFCYRVHAAAAIQPAQLRPATRDRQVRGLVDGELIPGGGGVRYRQPRRLGRGRRHDAVR
ncbi:MAG: signal peptidase I [Gaiellaceae bacterium]